MEVGRARHGGAHSGGERAPVPVEDAARIEEIAFDTHGQPIDAYNVACCFARLGRSDTAMQWLERAVASGYSDVAGLDADEDLATLRARDDYAALRATLGDESHARLQAEVEPESGVPRAS